MHAASHTWHAQVLATYMHPPTCTIACKHVLLHPHPHASHSHTLTCMHAKTGMGRVGRSVDKVGEKAEGEVGMISKGSDHATLTVPSPLHAWFPHTHGCTPHVHMPPICVCAATYMHPPSHTIACTHVLSLPHPHTSTCRVGGGMREVWSARVGLGEGHW